MKSNIDKTPIVFLPCTGLGHVNRGYESFSRECFEQLKDCKEFKLILLKAVGENTDNEIRVPCIHRNSKLSILIRRIFGVKEYWLEQGSFLISMLPLIIKYKPALIYYSDTVLGKLLWSVRKASNFNYNLLLSNGAPKSAPFYTDDHVQQLLLVHQQKACKANTPMNKQTLLHYGLNISNNFIELNNTDKNILKDKFLLPIGKKIIISVGAVNSHHKRMDYIVTEFSKLNPDEYFLVILGNIDKNSQSIIALANSILQPESFSIKNVEPNEVSNYLKISNYFILASLTEGSPRVLVEALQFGLTPIVHDYCIAREVLTNYGVFADLNNEGILQDLINSVDKLNFNKAQLWSHAYNNYSWELLKEQYIKMIFSNIYRN
ncbi:glycosyltransferase [Spirosoma validum]|uniref:Glycosyltransferase n=1 Tax=Spirosoma validum TaxID=2771355 RepID=A0A927B0U4_9BACT|nr:glycosyltransferase [Spirosoma validum]MBD2753301.1 glycosyltransferase [Spirosoma validum]